MDEKEQLFSMGKFISTVIHQWRLFISILVISIIVGFMIVAAIPKHYTAFALVATNKVVSSASFGSSIQTLSEDQSSTLFSKLDPTARLDSYVKFVKDPEIAQSVLDNLNSKYKNEDLDVSALLEMVSGQVAGRSDSIQINFTNKNPEFAAEVANMWSKYYVAKVNNIYAGSGTSNILDSIKSQSLSAKNNYEKAQSGLEQFLAQNQEHKISTQIFETTTQISILSLGYTSVISQVVNLEKQSSLLAFEQSVTDIRSKLTEDYDTRRLLSQYVANAQDMYNQVQNGGDGAAASNSLALNLLKAKVFATNGDLGNLVIQTSTLPIQANQMLSDLESLIKVLNDRIQALDVEIQTLSSELSLTSGGGKLDVSLAQQAQTPIQSFSGFQESSVVSSESDAARQQKIQALENQLNELKSSLEKEQSIKQELTRARDLAWDTYKSLAAKEAELEVTNNTSGSEVVLAIPATVPTKDDVSGVKILMISILVGLLLGIVLPISLEYWWDYKGVKPHPFMILPRHRNE